LPLREFQGSREGIAISPTGEAVCGSGRDLPTYSGQSPQFEKVSMGSLIKKRRKKMSKHKYRKRLRANRHKKK
jgi:hypothetical protein